MLGIVVTEPNKLQVVDVPEPTPGPYEARVRTELACLCNMTDRKLIEGHFPGVEKYPLLLGHETVGIVDAVGDKVRNFKVGDRVVGGLLLNTTDPKYASGWGGFSGYTIATDHKAMVADGVADADHGWLEVHEIMRSVPNDVAVEDAVMLCTWREVYGGFGDFNLTPGKDLVVFGAGPVGLSFVKFGRLLGLNNIYSVDLMPAKREKALEMGATEAFAPDSPEFKSLLERRGGKRLDALVDAVGKESIINACLPLVKLGGTIGVYGVIDTPSIRVDKDTGPYNFDLIIHQWPTRKREHDAQEPLIEWIRAGKLSYKEFVSAEYPIQDIAAAFENSKTGKPIKTLLRY
ncbi:MAG: alcohol dehydrogenase catalytic domain-containing protein [Anaerolineae bacterium]|nr:alcohol dehydrogenase catalytic domain-containing protein [Anaerolineae bacterium]